MLRRSLFTGGALVVAMAATTLFAGCATAVNDAIDDLTPDGVDPGNGQADSGAAKKDGGKTSSADSGSTVGNDDAGATTGDAGGGSDTGTIGTDAGTVGTDAGTVVVDSGTVTIDAGTTAACAPAPVSGLATKYHGPAGAFGDCSIAEIAKVWTACVDPTTSSSAACGALPTLTQAYCVPCLLTQSTASTWGALVYYPDNTVSLNSGGCYGILSTAASQCAHSSEYAAECDHAACDSVCATTDADYQSCLSTAEQADCSSYVQSETSQCAAYASSGCAAAGSFEASFKSIGALMCGP